MADTIRLALGAGLAGCSIEDHTGRDDDPIYPLELAAERVAAAAEAAHAGPVRLVLTARAENHVHGRDDLDDTIARLLAFQAAGADVLYPTGLTDLAAIGAVVAAVERPVNILVRPGLASVGELADAGVSRISVGGAFAFAALGALIEAAAELRDAGTYGFLERAAAGSQAARTAFAPRRPTRPSPALSRPGRRRAGSWRCGCVPLSIQVIRTRSPGWKRSLSATSADGAPTAWPASEVIVSHGLIPAAAAGPPGGTAATYVRPGGTLLHWGGRSFGLLVMSIADQRRAPMWIVFEPWPATICLLSREGGVDRDREPLAGRVLEAEGGRGGGVHADHRARPCRRAARPSRRAAAAPLSSISPCSCSLVWSTSSPAVIDLVRPTTEPLGRRRGAADAAGVADRDHRLADADAGRVAERHRREARGALELEHRDVARRVVPDDASGVGPAVADVGGGDAAWPPRSRGCW